MRRSEAKDLHIPQRQSRFAIILILVKFIRMMIRQLWPILLVLVINPGGSIELYLGIFTLVIMAFSLFGSLMSYFKFYYFIKDDKLHVEKGFLRRTTVNVPFERIQSINFEQNILHQLLNVVSLKVDTAGTKGSEIAFDALEKDQAGKLRNYILSQKKQVSSDHVAEGIPDDDEDENRELILSLTPRDLVMIGISQNHFRTAGLILLFFFGLLDNINDVVAFDVFERVHQQLGSLLASSLILLAIGSLVFLFASFLITLVRTVFVHYDLHFWKTKNGFKLISGLMTRKERTAKFQKVQLISWSNNPIRRLFGIFTLKLYQASSVDVLGGQSIAIPGCYAPQVRNAVRTIIPGTEQATYEVHGIHPVARLRYIFFFGILPLAIISAFGYLFGKTILYWTWILLPVVTWMAHTYYRKRQLFLHPDLLKSRSGIFGDQFKIIEVFKIQSVSVSQSFYQVRKDLANLHVHTASGEITMPFVTLAKARQIQDYLMYRIESDNRGWM